MNTFVCKTCGYIAFDNAPVDCPVCRSPIENFGKNTDAVKRPLDPQCLNEIEKMHTPVVTVSKTCSLVHGSGCFDVSVKVGEIEHVMESEHYITSIDFYVNKRYIARIRLTYKRLYPAASLHLNVREGTLSVIENCNVHGSWIKEVNLS